jgi:hypothetical protein
MAATPAFGTGRIRGPIHLTNALIAVLREEGLPRILEAGTGFDSNHMVLTLRIDISAEQLEAAATLLRETIDQPTRKTKEAAHG